MEISCSLTSWRRYSGKDIGNGQSRPSDSKEQSQKKKCLTNSLNPARQRRATTFSYAYAS